MQEGIGSEVGTESTSGHYGQACGQCSSPPLAIVGWAVAARRGGSSTHMSRISITYHGFSTRKTVIAGQNLSEIRDKTSPGMKSRPTIALARLIENTMAPT